MSAYDATRHPRLDGSVFVPSLGLHVHVGMRDGRLARVGLSHDAHVGAPLEAASNILSRVAAHCETGQDDFRDVTLDLSGVSEFERVVLTTLMREVGPGAVCTYGDLARRVGKGPGSARAIGGVMARNPMPLVIPCHRVLPAGRRIGNYSGEGGWETKMALLRIEGAKGAWQQRTL